MEALSVKPSHPRRISQQDRYENVRSRTWRSSLFYVGTRHSPVMWCNKHNVHALIHGNSTYDVTDNPPIDPFYICVTTLHIYYESQFHWSLRPLIWEVPKKKLERCSSSSLLWVSARRAEYLTSTRCTYQIEYHHLINDHQKNIKIYIDVIGKVRCSNADGRVETSSSLDYFIMSTAIWHNSYQLITNSRTHINL